MVQAEFRKDVTRQAARYRKAVDLNLSLESANAVQKDLPLTKFSLFPPMKVRSMTIVKMRWARRADLASVGEKKTGSLS